MHMSRRTFGALTAVGALGVTTRAAGADQTLWRYTRDTWRSLDAMVVPATGLPADNIGGELAPSSRSQATSPTNVGMYLWATVTARDLGLLSRSDATMRIHTTLTSLRDMQRHEPSGMWFNWYDPATGALLTEWPTDGHPVYPFLSSVDNGWLAAALLVVREAVPELRSSAGRLLASTDFGYYYDPLARGADYPAGLMRGGFWVEPPPDGSCTVKDNYGGEGADVYYTCHHYGALAETRIATYLGIALEQVPAEHYLAVWRTFPDTCDYSWQEQKPQGQWRTIRGVPVFEGTYVYGGMRLVPNWGGSMFEALMAPLVVPEEDWAPRSWGRNHPLFVRAQIHHGLREAKYGYWGFSPSNDPHGGYRTYGVDAIGLDSLGYTSDKEETTVDLGYAGCREAQPLPEEYGDGVVTPHASFLALRYAPHAAMGNLAALRRDFDSYGPGGFYDAIAVRSGTVSKSYLALDQGMAFAALGNALTGDRLRRYFAAGTSTGLRDIMGLESWQVG